MPSLQRTRILIAEGSTIHLRAIISILDPLEDVDLLEPARDGFTAIRSIMDQRPDVLLLAMDLPKLNGRDTLRKVMSSHPTATILLHDRPETSAQEEPELIQMGALYVVAKPPVLRLREELQSLGEKLAPLIRRAARIKVVRILSSAAAQNSPAARNPLLYAAEHQQINEAIQWRLSEEDRLGAQDHRIILIGASTGGPGALKTILQELPSSFPLPILIAQHMPGGFTGDLAAYLDGECKIAIREAKNDDRIEPGVALIGPGLYHMRIRHAGTITLVAPHSRLENCPSVNELFKSAAARYRENVLAAVLTGMGDDGAAGVRTVKALGGRVLAQNEKTSAIYGMPKEAVASGCVDLVAPLQDIARIFISFANSPR